MRKYIICFFIILSVGVLSYSFFGNYDNIVLSEEEKQLIENKDEQVLSSMDKTDAATQMILEIYNEVTCITKKNVSAIPATYIGLGRSELLDKMAEYMENLPLNEIEQGLISYDLMYFSNEYIMLRKTYHPDEDFQKYYIKFSNGIVTVFYSDQKTVYEYTEIELDELPVKLRSEIISGKTIKDEKALFDFLENYSS